jgi:hypothetical protein
MLTQQARASTTQGQSQDEGDDDRVVELSRDGDEIRHEVDRHRQVTDQHGDHDLSRARYARIPEKPSKQHDAVRDEPGESACVCPAAGQHEREHEGRVDEQGEGGADPYPAQRRRA